MILIAGPYRSGTDDDPVLDQAQCKRHDRHGAQGLWAGHMPVLGEWFALPLIEHAGSRRVGDAILDEIFHPIARRLAAS